MARLRLYPHRTAAPAAVAWNGWWIERDGVRTPLPSMLQGWDYASAETVGISAAIDHRELLQSSGLANVDDLTILAIADCALVQDRLVARRQLQGLDEGAELDVALPLPAGRLAGSVRLSAHLVLSRTSEPLGDRIAHHSGARLHSSDPVTLRLEGDGSRFPTEPVAFSELGIGRAPWTVLTAYDDLSDSFMGGVRLLVNTEHPVGRMALDPETAHRTGKLLRAEIVRVLIARVAEQIQGIDPEDLDEDSVGRVLDTMCTHLLNRGLRATAQLYQDDPARFEVLLHEELDPLGGMIE